MTVRGEQPSADAQSTICFVLIAPGDFKHRQQQSSGSLCIDADDILGK